MPSHFERKCTEKGIKMTRKGRVIARVLSESDDHPDAVLIHQRARKLDPKICLGTVYRTMHIFEKAGAIGKYDFSDGRTHYEEIEHLQYLVAKKLGYAPVGHRLDLLFERKPGSNTIWLSWLRQPVAWQNPDSASTHVCHASVNLVCT